MSAMVLDGSSILITGGTGSFGRQCVRSILKSSKPRRLIVFSRDEFKQSKMQEQFPSSEYPCLRFFLGDVRDRERLNRAFAKVDYVIHAAALKQIPAAEYNPVEPIRTNILGAVNVIDCAIDRNVERVIALSTDKAVNPVNLYGASKLCSDKLFVSANHYSGSQNTRFGVVRCGNVMGSRGSVIPFFWEQRHKGVLPVTDPRMTRFWMTPEKSVQFVLECLARVQGGEVFVPKIPSMKIMDLVEAVAPGCSTKVIGIRPGEKLHETMISEDDARLTLEYDGYFTILPAFHDWDRDAYVNLNGGRPCPEGFRYSSESNPDWLTVEEMRLFLERLGHDSFLS